MPSMADMHRLAQEIVDSSETRSAELAALREQVVATCRATVAELNDAGMRRQAVAAQYRHDSECRRRELAIESEQLASGEAQRKAACHSWLGGIGGARQSAASEQRSGLAQSRASLISKRTALASEEASRKTGVDAWLQRAAAAHRQLAHEQRNALAQIAPALASARAEIDRADHTRRSATVAELREIAVERKGVRQEWQGISAARQVRRRAKSVPSAGDRTARPTVGALSRKAQAESTQVHSEAPATTSDTGGLRDQVFQFLANHPDGTRLVELAQQFGLAHVQMARIVRGLLDDNKVEKRDLLYFAI